ncbi:MAG: hypothetical protein AAF907_09810 [Planctomycetota bacterium]
MKAILRDFLSRTPYALAMGIGGALIFVWVQVFNQPIDVAIYVGERAVEIGGYPEHFVSPIGWTTHIAISLSYAFLCAAVASLPPVRAAGRSLVVSIPVAIGVGLVLGYVTTVIAYPAIVITTSFLGGAGFPKNTWEIGVNWGQVFIPLVNHLWFYPVGLLITGVLPDALRDRRRLTAA